MELVDTQNSCLPKNVTFRLSILLIAWAIAFYPIFRSLFHAWASKSDNSYCMLVPLISLFFIWNKREQVKTIPITKNNIGLFIMLVSMVLYIISYVGDLAFISRLMIIFSLIGLLTYTLGEKIVKILAFPLFFLLFIVPVPDSILNLVAFPLQLLATNISYSIISALSIPVHQEGNILYFAQAHIEIVEACSGIRSIISLTMLSVILAFLSNNGFVTRFILILSAIPLALIANIIRITSSGILAHFWGQDAIQGVYHDFSGFVVFFSGFILLIGEFLFLNKRRSDEH